MNSQYFGQTGSQIGEYQKQLNALGANLKIDNNWGPLTESAYQQYKDQLPNGFTTRTEGDTGSSTGTTTDTSTPAPTKSVADQIKDLLQQLTDLNNKPLTDYPVLTLEEAKSQASSQYKTPYDLLAQQTKQALDLDAERRGIFNSPLAASIMMQKNADLKGKYDTDVATLAQTLVTNSQATSLQNRQFEQDARTAETNRLTSLLQNLQNERAYADAKKRSGGGGVRKASTPIDPLQVQYEGAQRWLNDILNGNYSNTSDLGNDMYTFLNEVGNTLGSEVKNYMYKAVAPAYRAKYNKLSNYKPYTQTAASTKKTSTKTSSSKAGMPSNIPYQYK